MYELLLYTVDIVGWLDSVTVRARGVARNLLRGDKRGGLGTEVPQRGPRAEARWRSGAKPPEATGKC